MRLVDHADPVAVYLFTGPHRPVPPKSVSYAGFMPGSHSRWARTGLSGCRDIA